MNSKNKNHLVLDSVVLFLLVRRVVRIHVETHGRVLKSLSDLYIAYLINVSLRNW